MLDVILNPSATLIFNESLEAAKVVDVQLERNQGVVNRLVERFADQPPKLLVTSARGSSYHATSYARSLFELELGVISSALTPSVNTLYKQELDLSGALFLTVSQSGESPDLIIQAKAAKRSGAFVLAIVNNTDSTLCSVADEVLPIYAGLENSVAATKSFIGSLSNIALLVAGLKKDKQFLSSIQALPDALKRASQVDWSRGLDSFATADRAFILGRGPCLAIACEAALKMKETCGIHAEAFSTAEVKHGPMTLIRDDFPVLVFNPPDESYRSNCELIENLAERNPNMLVVDSSNISKYGLPAPVPLHPRLNPILVVQAFYPFVSSLALLRGYDPDKPQYLSKVTRTV